MRFFCTAAVLLSAGTIRAQDDNEALAKKAYEMAAVEAKSLVLQLDSKDLKLESRSLMRWSNPLSGQVYGDVYIWTMDGRPEAIASIFKSFSPNTHLSTELQSLSESPLVATKGNQQVWNPTPGLEMELLPNVAAPRAREFQRLQQMRAILGEFKAEAVDRKVAIELGVLSLVTASDKLRVGNGQCVARHFSAAKPNGCDRKRRFRRLKSLTQRFDQ